MIDYNKLLDEQNQITKSLLSKELSVPMPNYEDINPLRTNPVANDYFRSKFQREFAPKVARANRSLNFGRQQTLFNYYMNQAQQAGLSLQDAMNYARQRALNERQYEFESGQNKKNRESQNRIEQGAENLANQGLNIETENYYRQNLPQIGVGTVLASILGQTAGTLGGYYLYKGLTGGNKPNLEPSNVVASRPTLREQTLFTPRTFKYRRPTLNYDRSDYFQTG